MKCLTSYELACIVAKTDGVSIGTAEDVVEARKPSIVGYYGCVWNADTNLWVPVGLMKEI